MTLIRFPRYNRCATRPAGAYRIAGYKTNQFPADWNVGTGNGGAAGGVNYLSWQSATDDPTLAVWENYDWMTVPVAVTVFTVGTDIPEFALNINGTESVFVNGQALTINPSDVIRWSYTPSRGATGSGTMYFLRADGSGLFGPVRPYSY